jgi:RNA polymerase sigma-70 factor, ECF subfamily
VEPSDEVLCERVARGEEAAFDLLVTRYQHRAWRLAWNVLRDAEDARDASQEAFVRLYRAANQFAGRARFSTWFYRVLVNVCLEHRRKHRWWRHIFASAAGDDEAESSVEHHPAPAVDVLGALDREQALTRLQAAMGRLSPQQRAVVTLQLDGLPTEEIAEALHCSEATVRVHLHRALTTLRKIVEHAPVENV